MTGASLQVSVPAAAQEISASDGMEDIVVTARRRDESLQSVPIAVQAFTGQTLAEQNVQDASDLQKLVPALTTNAQARDEVTISIRGMASAGATAQGQTPRVTTYFAQVPLQTGDNGPGHFFDLQNVQVLKGPQGTLFGRNSTGGAILYEPARPKQELGGYINAQLGRFHDSQVEGAFNAPLTDTLAVRIAGKYAARDGFTKNLVTGQMLDDRNYWALRGSIAWNPSERFDTYLVVDYMKSDTNGSSQQIVGYDPNHVYAADVSRGAVPGGLPLTLGGRGPSLQQFISDPGTYFPQAIAARRVAYYPDPILSDIYNAQAKRGPRVAFSSVDGVSRMRSLGVTNISTYHVMDDMIIRNIFGFRRFKQMSRYDLDGMTLPILDQTTPDGMWSTNIQQISNEIQLQGKAFDNRLDYTIGGFFLWGKSIGAQRSLLAALGSPALTISRPIEKSQSAYVQLTYEVIDNVHLTAGYRFTHDYRSTAAANYRDATLLPTQVPAETAANCTYLDQLDAGGNLVSGCPRFVEVGFNSSSYNFSIDYQMLPTVLLYAAHRRGFRSGGLNPQAINFGFAYGPEKVLDFEIGTKTDFTLGSMRGRFNIAAFHSKLKGAQKSQPFSTQNARTGATEIVNLITNAVGANITGVEIELNVIPVRGLNLSAAYSLTDAKYGKFVNSITGVEQALPFPYLAKNRLNLAGSYTVGIPGNFGDLTFGANWLYSSRYSLSVVDEPFSIQAPYNQLDLRVDWKNFDSKKVRVSFFVNNVTNQTYRIGGVPVYNALGTTSGIYNEPRTWGLQFHYAFGGE